MHAPSALFANLLSTGVTRLRGGTYNCIRVEDTPERDRVTGIRVTGIRVTGIHVTENHETENL